MGISKVCTPTPSRAAGAVSSAPGTRLGTLDALHLATALTLDGVTMVTYDQRLGQAAEHAGLPVLAPGREAGWLHA